MARATQDITIWDETNDNSAMVDSEGRLKVLINQNNLYQEKITEGKGFVLTTNFVSISGTSVVNFLLLRNPNNSGKTIRIKKIVYQHRIKVATDISRFRIYRNPTITSNGTALTINKMIFTQPNTPVLLSSLTPTISSVGTLFKVYTVVNSLLIDEDLTFFILPNENILVTVQNAATNKECAITLEFIEE